MNIDYKKVIEVFIKELCEDMSYYPTKYSIQINSCTDTKNIKFLNQLIERYSSIIMLNATNALAYYKRGYVFFGFINFKCNIIFVIVIITVEI